MNALIKAMNAGDQSNERFLVHNQCISHFNINKIVLSWFQELIHQHMLSMAQLDPDDQSKLICTLHFYQ